MSALGKGDPNIERQQAETARYLIASGVNTQATVHNSIDLFPAILCAWFGGNQSMMELLVRHGGLSEAQFPCAMEFCLEPHQRSGLMHADMAGQLLNLGYSVDAPRADQGGRTVLHGCANRGSVAPVQWLLEHDARVDVTDHQMRTPLHVSCERNTGTKVIELLLSHGADINAVDCNGETPIETARRKKRSRVVGFLDEYVPARQGR